MPEDRITVSLEEFLGYLLKKWKIAAVIVVVFAALFAGGAILIGEEIEVPHSEEYLYYEQEVAYLKSYQEKSVLMNLDPTCIYERTLFIKNISDKQILKDYVKSSEIWMDFETDREKEYIWELVEWNGNKSTDTAEVKVRHATSEECMECAEYLAEKLAEKDPLAEIVIGAESITTDGELQDKHLSWYSRIEYAESLLLDAQAGYTIKINKAAAVLVGVLAGGVFAVAAGLISYMRQRKRENQA